MKKLVLLYAADEEGNFTDKDGKCWNIPLDRQRFRSAIEGESIICGRKTFQQDWKGLRGARYITLLSKKNFYGILCPDLLETATKRLAGDVYCLNSGLLALKRTEPVYEGANIYCVGGKQVIEALAPFASEIMMTQIASSEAYFSNALPAYMPPTLGLVSWNSNRTSLRQYGDKLFAFYRLERNVPINLEV